MISIEAYLKVQRDILEKGFEYKGDLIPEIGIEEIVKIMTEYGWIVRESTENENEYHMDHREVPGFLYLFTRGYEFITGEVIKIYRKDGLIDFLERVKLLIDKA